MAAGTGLRELIDTAGTHPEIRVPAVSLLAELLTAQGALRTGLRLDGEAWNGARTREPGASPGVRGPRGAPLPEPDPGRRLGRARTGPGRLRGPRAGTAAVQRRHAPPHAGILEAAPGQDARKPGRSAAGCGRTHHRRPLNLLPFAHAVAAYAAAAVGRHHEASQHSLAYRLSEYREPKTLRLLAEAYCRAAEPGRRARTGTVPDALARLADEALREGLRGVETDIRRLAFRSGDTSGAEALALSSSAVDGPEARLLESYARAVSASDAADLIGISDDALNGGHGLLALEAAQQAERILADDPDRWRLTAVQRRVHHRLVEAGMSAQLELVHSDHGAALTAREAEVLELVSGGATNGEIAAALCVSHRTVEGHLSPDLRQARRRPAGGPPGPRHAAP